MSSRLTAMGKWLVSQLRRFWHPTLVFGAIVVGVIWTSAVLAVRNDIRSIQNSSWSDVKNYSLLFQQDVLLVTTNLDRILKFIRRTYERAGYEIDWATLVQEDFTSRAATAQIAVIDQTGRMITSSAMPYPKERVDLSDREHFKFHKTSNSDVLHISRPVVGRASGKSSIQFTRRFTRRDGSFAGVLVVSLDPVQLLSKYDQLEGAEGVSFAVLGDDDIIRAGSGYFRAKVGRGYSEDRRMPSTEGDRHQLELSQQMIEGRAVSVAITRVPEMPLSVVTALATPWVITGRLHQYYFAASILSALVAAAAAASFVHQRRHVNHITNLAHRDALTGLQNRLSFRETLRTVTAGANQHQNFALHLIDLDRFKAVNDTFGHPIGDELLRAVAARLLSSVRSSDILFRLGGDEFALLQMECGVYQQAETVARRLCKALGQQFSIKGNQVSIGASIGIALSNERVGDMKDLQKAADFALYQAKAAGRGTYSIYDKKLGSAVIARQGLEADLKISIEKGQLEVHYQPKVRLNGEAAVLGYEALIRWRHPSKGLIPPLDFIGIAEENGFIVDIGTWLLDEVCERFARRNQWETVAVNCSPVQFANGRLLQDVTAALAKSGLPAHRLELELTETTLMTHEAIVTPQLVTLREMGVRISLDDFGTGYSSLSYIARYPIDCIKIDRSFVARLNEDRRALVITQTILSLAKELNLTAVAEGVETEDQLLELRRLGCDVAQGYYFGKPALLSDLTERPVPMIAAA